jgi:Spy/CpxP family protein refolding chaperone
MVTGAGGSSFFGSLISSGVECRFIAARLLVADCSRAAKAAPEPSTTFLMLRDRPGDSRRANTAPNASAGARARVRIDEMRADARRAYDETERRTRRRVFT